MISTLKLLANVHSSWHEFLSNSIIYDETFINNLNEAYQSNTCFPDYQDILRFMQYPLNEIKVIILGQDPYHTKGVADGLAFSSKATKIPPSLRNIFKELNNDLGINNTSPNLESWAQQGVCLLNTYLSVKEGLPKSHHYLRWDLFIKPLIKYLDHYQSFIFVLWGNSAQDYERFINNGYLIRGGHPSPLSQRYFMNGHYFSKINALLLKQHLSPIDWRTY
ncbi:MAG: uracil-DNA glycosylase [Bacilli bacterium]|jgi:uracil-DNA glycosylase|nr:uracil-DNA glycosylase [Bacilli bacterium]